MANRNPQTGRLVPTWAERREFDRLSEQAKQLQAYKDARIKVASMSPAERAAAITAANRARVARWAADPRTIARMKSREVPIVRR